MNNPEYVKIGEDKIKINTSYKIGIKVQDLFTNPLISEYEKIYGFICLLYGEEGINYPNSEKLVELGLKYLNLGKQREETNEETTIDLIQDFDYIKASFMSDYHIDLTKEDIHWWTFITLLNGLTENTIMSKVRQIRAEDLSDHKGKDREKWVKLKSQVALVHRKNNKELELDKFWEDIYERNTKDSN